MMPTPAYFQALAVQIIAGYRMGRYVDEKRAALVGTEPPKDLTFNIGEGGNIDIKVQGKLVPMPTINRYDNITTWNKRMLACGNANGVNTVKNEMIRYFTEAIESHLIFRDLSGDDDYGKPQYVRDEEER